MALTPPARGCSRPTMSHYFPLLAAAIDQTASYARYVAETREVPALVWGVIFALLFVVPALILDLIRLPVKAYEAISGRTAARARP